MTPSYPKSHSERKWEYTSYLSQWLCSRSSAMESLQGLHGKLVCVRTPVSYHYNKCSLRFYFSSNIRPQPYSMLNNFCRGFVWPLFAARIVLKKGNLKWIYTLFSSKQRGTRAIAWELEGLHSGRNTIFHNAGTACRYSYFSSSPSKS